MCFSELLCDVIRNKMRSPDVLMYLQWAGFILIRILEFNANRNVSGLNRADKSWKNSIIMLKRPNEENFSSLRPTY